MKKTIPILLIIVLALSGLEAVALSKTNENNLIEKTEIINISSPTLTNVDEYLKVELSEATSLIMNAGEPVLPKVTKVYILPVGSNIKDVSVIFSNEKYEILDKDVRPAPEPIIEGKTVEKTLVKSNEIYQSADSYPENSFYYRIASGRYNDEHVMFLIIHCYPVRYSPAQNLLTSYNKMDISYSYDKPNIPENTKEGYDLLIIAPEKFSSEIDPFVQHKLDNNVDTNFVTLEEIYADYTTGRDDPENIKLFIKDEFDENDISYVLLIGGHIGQRRQWYVPVRNTNNHAGGTFESGVDSDLYYADLYKENGTVFEDWDSNGNDVFAEFTTFSKDIIDGIPDVYVGRLACRSKREVRTLVNKIINYESTKADDAWFKNMLLIGGDTYPDSGDPLGYEAELDTNVSASYMTGFSFERLWASTGALTGQDVVEDAINDGAGFVHMAGHANPSVLVTHPPQSEDTITILRMYNIYQPLKMNPRLRNKDMLPVVVIGGCHNSQFNVSLSNILHGVLNEGFEYFNYTFYRQEWVPKCFSWWLTSKPNGGVIAAMGNTGLGMGLPGFDYPDGLDGWLLPRFFYNYGQLGVENVGAAHSAAIADYVLEFDINSDDADRQMVEQWPLLGDPSLMIGGYE